MIKKHIITFLLCTCTMFTLNAQVTMVRLRCEMMTNPQGIDAANPRFSWQLESNQKNVQQLAYEILVSSSESKLQKNEADIWYSGRVNSSNSHLIPYTGKVLASAKKFFWKARSYTNKGE